MTTTRIVSWHQVLSDMPLIAILRGIQPREAVGIAEALQSAGFLCAEVPLNSPNALQTISTMRAKAGGALFVGAGTVLTTADVSACHDAGAQFIVSPNTNANVIQATKEHELISVPGFLTPSEAFIAIEAGAGALKLFPAENATPSVLRALKAVIPKLYPILPVGGITPENMEAYIRAGAAGFGIGSALYSPGASPETVHERALSFVKAWATDRH